MKNLDFKKLAVLIGIIAAIVVAIILLVVGIGKSNKLSKEETEKVNNYITNNIIELTEGYDSKYKGKDALFASEKVQVDKLSAQLLINSAIKYAEINEWTNSIPSYKVNQAAAQGFSKQNYSIYEGETIRKAIKELYNIDFKNTNAIDLLGYRYNFYYLQDIDVYMKETKQILIDKDGYDIEYTIVETKKKDDKLTVIIAVAYTYNDGSKKYYSNDENNTNIIFESETDNSEIIKDKINSFNKYKIIFSQDSERIYFESIEKLK